MNDSTLLRLGLCAALASLPGAAQSVKVYSEFRRVDPFGQLLEPEFRPREILSPGVPRNAWSSFRIAVTAPAGTAYVLHVGQNPDNAVRAVISRERYAQQNGRWVPVSLDRVDIPYNGKIPDAVAGVEGQTTQTFWLDIWVDADAPVRRIKVEPQVNIGDDWLIYPMEVRVVAAKVPGAAGAPTQDFRQFFCGAKSAMPPPPAGSPGALVWRNQMRDIQMMQELEKQRGRMVLFAQLADRLGAKEPKPWCAATASAPPADPEWWLRLRDFLLRGAGFN